MTSTDTATPPGPLQGDAALLSAEQARAIVRLVEGAPTVRRRYQFFVWTQTPMQALLPHQLLVCGAYQRQRRSLVLDAFHNVVLPAALLQAVTDPDGPLLRALLRAWLAARGQPCAVSLAELAAGHDTAAALARGMREAVPWSHLLVHASSRPQRLDEIETLFVFSASGLEEAALRDHRCACLDLLLPHLHSTWQRTASTELALESARALPPPPSRALPATPAAPARAPGVLTGRELQILHGVREGLSNHEIGQRLGISALTVKNHVQKILRKLQAGNRAQAVGLALARQLIDHPATEAPPAAPAP